MTRLFRSKSCTLSMPQFNSSSPTPSAYKYHQEEEEDEGYFGDFNSDDEVDYDSENPVTTPFISPSKISCSLNQQPHFSVLAVIGAALRKSLVTCSVEDEGVDSDVDIGCPTDVRHVSHVTFDRFNGFLGIPVELQPEVPRKPPSASASVFGVSPQSMQCSNDHRGNSVPVILLRMQNRLYSEGGLQAEGIFRINAENSQEEIVRKQLNRGVVPLGIDVHCLSGWIKAWFRELPSGVLDSLTSEQVMHCNTEEECTQLVKLLPPTEAALLDWAINLMADIAQHEHQNKMNSRNIAMVFAPNMTQMADPLTALIHAVQVMNFLKTLIVKTIHERENQSRPAASSDRRDHHLVVKEQSSDRRDHHLVVKEQSSDDYTRKLAPDNNPSRSGTKRRTLAGSFKEEYDMEAEGILNRLSLRRGMRKLRRHPVFLLSKTVKKIDGLEL